MLQYIEINFRAFWICRIEIQSDFFKDLIFSGQQSDPKANIHVGKAVINIIKIHFLLTKCCISQLGMHTILQLETIVKNIVFCIVNVSGGELLENWIQTFIWQQ